MASSSSSSLSAIRTIARELRHSLGQKKIRDEPAIRYLLDEARTHDMTDGRICRPTNELKFLASVYACYLDSSRKYNELQERYASKEKTVEEAAEIVGLALPKKPHD